MAEPKRSGRSIRMRFHSTLRCRATIATMPMTSKMLAMFEPTTLLATMADSPLRTEIIEVATSGRDVPMLTMVTPTINWGIPMARPSFSAYLVNKSEDLMSRKRLIVNTMMIEMRLLKRNWLIGTGISNDGSKGFLNVAYMALKMAKSRLFSVTGRLEKLLKKGNRMDCI